MATVQISESNGPINVALTGTVAVTTGSATVTGTGTLFTTELRVGETIRIVAEVFRVSAIASNTSLTLSSNYLGTTASGLTAHIPARTANITNTNMGDIDSANLDTLANPVIPGQNTFEKWQRIEVTAMGGASRIDNLKVWRTGALGGAAVHKTNVRTSDYGGATTYVPPVKTTSTIATQTMPTTAPATANLGIGGVLTGSLTAPGISDYLIHQIQTNIADISGSTSTLNYQYDVVS